MKLHETANRDTTATPYPHPAANKEQTRKRAFADELWAKRFVTVGLGDRILALRLAKR